MPDLYGELAELPVESGGHGLLDDLGDFVGFGASALDRGGVDIVAIQELLGQEWDRHGYGIPARQHHSYRRLLGAGRRMPGGVAERGAGMKWDLRMAAARREIWRASDLRRLLAEYGMEISAGKMSGLWSGQPISIRLDDLEVICAALKCGPEELLLREPETLQARPSQTESRTAADRSSAVTPRRRSGRTALK